MDVVLANYFFDTIPHDLFVCRDGELFEARVRLCANRPDPDPTDPTLLGCVSFAQRTVPAPSDCFGDVELDGLLQRVRARPGTSWIRFPIAALRVLQGFRRRADGGFLLVSCDKGETGEGVTTATTAFSVHGSVSVSVDYATIAAWFRDTGGVARLPPQQHASIAVVAGQHGGPTPETARAWAEVIEGFGPDEFFLLKGTIGAAVDTMPVDAILAWLRLTRGDARAVQRCVSALRKLGPAASPRQRADITRIVEQAWGNYFHLGEADDLAFELGALLLDIHEHHAALPYFERSLTLYGDHPATQGNICLCLYNLGRHAEALAVARRLLAADPDHEGARSLARLVEQAAGEATPP